MILTGSHQGKSFLLFFNFPGRLRSKKNSSWNIEEEKSEPKFNPEKAVPMKFFESSRFSNYFLHSKQFKPSIKNRHKCREILEFWQNSFPFNFTLLKHCDEPWCDSLVAHTLETENLALVVLTA